MTDFDRVTVRDAPGGTEYAVLGSDVVIDLGQGQGPKAGFLVVRRGGSIAAEGTGGARLSAGIKEQGGTFPSSLTLTDAAGSPTVQLAAHARPDESRVGRIYIEGASSTVRLRDGDGNEHVVLSGMSASVWLGGEEADGDLLLFAKGQTDNHNTEKATLQLDGETGQVHLRSRGGKRRVLLDPVAGNAWLGGKDVDGDLMLFASGEKDNTAAGKATIQLEGSRGKVSLRSSGAKPRITLDAEGGNLWIGGNDVDGDIMLFASRKTDHDDTKVATIHLQGDTGDIVLQNGDCAEDFDARETVEPGTVMVLAGDGGLCPSASPYDRRVAGVVSGAGDLRPGIILDRHGKGGRSRVSISLLGKVWCKVDSSSGPIEIGDLLTTGPTPGHAMKATDATRSFGALLGKALGAWPEGQGLIPILVTLG